MAKILIFISVLTLCNITLVVKGYSYIAYACVIALLLAHILFAEKHNRRWFAVLSTAFILSLFNILTEICYKLGVYSCLDPTRFDEFSFICIFYLIISIITGIIWSGRKTQ